MSRHIIFIDPLEKLVPKKDSSLLLAHELKKAGEDVNILFKDNLFLFTEFGQKLSVSLFQSQINDDFYLDNFSIQDELEIELNEKDIIHMRLEPPFDLSYMRSLWMLNYLKKNNGCKIINDPSGILLNNEKISSFLSDDYIDTFIGSSCLKFLEFVDRYKSIGSASLILKPIDLFQGIGVKKVNLDQTKEELSHIFLEMVKEFKGPVMVQPFQEEIIKGEIRSIYFDNKLIGAIKKVPVEGSFLANIAQGASFEKHHLTPKQTQNCEKVCSELGESVPWVAFDIIGDRISEVNVTCPGLLVEVSKAEKRNLAADIVSSLLH